MVTFVVGLWTRGANNNAQPSADRCVAGSPGTGVSATQNSAPTNDLFWSSDAFGSRVPGQSAPSNSTMCRGMVKLPRRRNADQ